MTNFNNRMVLDRKSEPVTAWSLVRPTSHRVDTHRHDMQDWHRWYDSVKICAILFIFLKTNKRCLIARNVAQRSLKLWWPECAFVFVNKKWRLQQDWEQVMERAQRRMFAGIIKKKNVVGEKASRSAYDLLYPPILQLYHLKVSHYERLWRGNLILLQSHARTICTDSLLIR